MLGELIKKHGVYFKPEPIYGAGTFSEQDMPHWDWYLEQGVIRPCKDKFYVCCHEVSLKHLRAEHLLEDVKALATGAPLDVFIDDEIAELSALGVLVFGDLNPGICSL